MQTKEGTAPFVVTQVRVDQALEEYSEFSKPWSLSSQNSASHLQKRRLAPDSIDSSNHPSKRKKIASKGPLDYQSFLQRVSTFKLSTWCADSKGISPLECARHGWINTDYDLLRCEACDSTLALKLPSVLFEDQGIFIFIFSWASNINLYVLTVREAERKFAEDLCRYHKPVCPWLDTACPPSFARDPFRGCNERELLPMFHARAELLAQQAQLPALSASVEEQLVGHD